METSTDLFYGWL